MPRVKVPITAKSPTSAKLPAKQPLIKPESVPEPPVTPVEPVLSGRKVRSIRQRLFITSLVIIVSLLIVTLITLLNQRNDLREQLSQDEKGSSQAAEEVDALVKEVGKSLQLPTGEKPTVITVSDVAKARQQSSFFENAQNGDKVLLYAQAKQAILYRPSTKKLIQVAPLSPEQSASPTTP